MSRDYQCPTIGPRSHDELLREVPGLGVNQGPDWDVRLAVAILGAIATLALIYSFITDPNHSGRLLASAVVANMALVLSAPAGALSSSKRQSRVKTIVVFMLGHVTSLVILEAIRGSTEEIEPAVWFATLAFVLLFGFRFNAWYVRPFRTRKTIDESEFPRL
jgi:hypothetical protein